MPSKASKKHGGLQEINLGSPGAAANNKKNNKKKNAAAGAEDDEEEQLRQLQELAQAAFQAQKSKTKKDKVAVEKQVENFKKKQEQLQEQYEQRQREIMEYDTREFDNETAIVPLDAVQVLDATDDLVNPAEWFLLGEKAVEGKDGLTKHWVRFEQFKAHHMEHLITLFSQELSEPYSCFTYEHFCIGWPDLSIGVYGYVGETPPAEMNDTDEMIGAVVSKVAYKTGVQSGEYRPLQGYIAMLAVVPAFRGFKLGQKLVRLTVSLMKKKGVDEVTLETPTYNEHAMKLYLDVGFIKKCFLTRYYLDGADAVRLILWLNPLRLARPGMPLGN